YLPNIPQWVISWLSLNRLGVTAVPIAHIYPPYELRYIANDIEAETIICLDTNFGYVVNVLPETRLKRVITTTMIECLPWWKRIIGRAFDLVPGGKIGLNENIFSFKSLLRKKFSSLPPMRSNGEDIAEVLYTGGTTGFPKGVPISHFLFLDSGIEHRRAMESLVPVGKAVVLQGGPLYHILGQVLGLVFICLTGDTIILSPRVNIDASLKYIEKYNVTNFFGVPALYRSILDHDRLDFYDLSSLKYCVIGGDIVPAEILDRWEKKFKDHLYEAYGITETCGGVAVTPGGMRPPRGSAGKVFPTKTVKVVEPDSLNPVGIDKPGELLVSSKYMVEEYWNKPEETAKCFINMDDKLWYRTNDIVRVDKDNWVYFSDRSADTIKHKGYRIAASEIEKAIQEHPSVTACCVTGIPDPRLGERIKAFVVLREDVRGVTGYDLIRFCRERLVSYKVPSYIEFRDMLPKSKVGKLLRRELRAEEKRKTD
ncbi:MAG: class I adenylate-forming enzyme family protein, partial [Thermodesulfobacteriota bacterium]|nr:class I adenylate-forming enzyme family protein [Thermodesulfobacteriota bacterium]